MAHRLQEIMSIRRGNSVFVTAQLLSAPGCTKWTKSIGSVAWGHTRLGDSGMILGWQKERVRMISTNDIHNGTVLNLDGQLWQVIWFQHHKPGKGNTVVRTKLKHVLTGKVVDRTFNSDVKIEDAQVDRREMQYLYHDGDGYVFMDTADYTQMTIPDDTVGDAKNFLLENGTASVAIFEGNPLFIELPASVELEITYTEPGLQGDRSSAGTKPATVETGYQIQVPLFITTGERVKVDTRDGSYISRV